MWTWRREGSRWRLGEMKRASNGQNYMGEMDRWKMAREKPARETDALGKMEDQIARDKGRDGWEWKCRWMGGKEEDNKR